MDHAINALSPFLEASIDSLRSEWKRGKGNHKKLSDCPSYSECKALVDAIHLLEKFEYGKHRTMSVSSLVNW